MLKRIAAGALIALGLAGCGGAAVQPAADDTQPVELTVQAAPATATDVVPLYPGALNEANRATPAQVELVRQAQLDLQKLAPQREFGEVGEVWDIGEHFGVRYLVSALGDDQVCYILVVEKTGRYGGADCGRWGSLATPLRPMGDGGNRADGGASLVALVQDAVESITLNVEGGAPVLATINGNVASARSDARATGFTVTLADGTQETTPMSPLDNGPTPEEG